MQEWFVYFPPMSVKPQVIPKEIRNTRELLDFLYDTIGCSSIETVRFSSPTERIIVDEEGLLKKDFQISPVGSALTESLIVGGIVLAREGCRDGEPDLIGYESMGEAIAAAYAASTIAKMCYNAIYGEEV